MLLELVEATAMSVAGDEAALTPFERMLIEEPLADVLARVTPQQAQRFNDILSPVLLASGLVIYGYRVLTLMERKRAENQDVNANVTLFSAMTPGRIKDEQPAS